MGTTGRERRGSSNRGDDMPPYMFTTLYLHAHYVIPLNTICCQGYEVGEIVNEATGAESEYLKLN